MVCIDRVTLREIQLTLKEPFRISSGVVHARRILLVELTDRDGATAWSECVALPQPNYFPETIDTAWLAIREWLAPRVLGQPLSSPIAAHHLLGENIRGHNMAKAALEMGCWALTAIQQQVPLSKLLGGTRDRVATGISLGIESTPDAIAERARAAVASGYRKIKVKIQPGRDVEFVRAVRKALGSEVEIMADANSAYTLDDAARLRELDEFDLLMLEQPLGFDDLVQHAALQRQIKTPICLDESITDQNRVRDMISLGSGWIVNIKPGRVGGFTTSIAIHDICREAGMPVWCGGMFESGIGRAYNVALASLPNFSLPGDLSPSARYWARDIVHPEWTMDADGMVRVPRQQPGIGVEIDEEAIDSITTRHEIVGTTNAMVAVS